MERGAKNGPSTVTDLLAVAARANPEGAALVWQGAAMSYRALEEASRRVAGGLAALGVGRGDRVAFWLPNMPAYLVLYFACVRLGAIAVAVNTRYRAAEVEDILGRTAAKLLVLWPGFRGIDFPGILAEVDRAALDRLETVVVCGEGDGAPNLDLPGRRIVRYRELTAQAPRGRDRATPGLGCNIFTTSGTTRAPKFVLHANAGIARHAAEVARDFGFDDPGTVTLMALPLAGVFGFAGTMATLAAARSVVLMPAFDAEEMLALIARHRVTHFDGSDDMIDRLLDAGGDEALFRRVRFAGFAAFNSALADIVERAERRGLRLVGLWGMSEMQALVARRDARAPAAERKKAGGRLVSPHGAARVRDPESGRLLAPGEAGELEIAGPSRMLEYWGDPEATRATLTDDGFVRTGDLCRMEKDGGFEFLSRMGDVLRLGGYLVSPAEIEDELLSHPVVEAAQVVAATGAGGQRAVAFVVLRRDAAFHEEALRAHCARRLAGYKVPVRILALDAFPVTESANGVKIQRAKLREMARTALADPAA